MDDEEVQKQLDHMVKFIYREADDKAKEIQQKAQEEFSIEKARIVTEAKLKIMKDFERKEKQIETKKKIAYSNELNNARLRLLKARDEGVQKILSDAQAALATLTSDPAKHKQLLQNLIVQGLVKLDESEVKVVARPEDAALVAEVLPKAVAEYTKKTNKQVRADLEKTMQLPPGPGKKVGEFCSGGVVLSAHEGKIVLSNTLDARLLMAYEQQLPLIRTTLFGKSVTRVYYD